MPLYLWILKNTNETEESYKYEQLSASKHVAIKKKKKKRKENG